MFREMRRPEQALTREECITLLKNETRGVLCMIGDDGYPYGVPINHYYDEDEHRLFFHGDLTGHRVDAIKANPKVSYCVYGDDQLQDGNWGYHVKSVICFGKAAIDEDHAHGMRMCKKLCDKFPCPPGYFAQEYRKDGARTLMIYIDIEHMTGKLVHEA